MKTHNLKCIPPYFEEICKGKKTFELRKNDRDFQVGDAINLSEWVDNKETGRGAYFKIGYILEDVPEFGLMEGYCIISFAKHIPKRKKDEK